MTAERLIYTAGYEGQSLDDFLNGLSNNGVKLLADVREAPISRKPGFSKSSLARALGQVGIEYIHIRPLGCPRPIRDAYRVDEDWDRYTCAFMQHLETQGAVVQELAGTATSTPTALLCYEADFNRCHRTYVARAVGARVGAVVRHITANGLVSDASYPASPPTPSSSA